MNLEQAVALEKSLHPLGTSQDLYKLIYQSCMGNGHAIESVEESYRALCKEKSEASEDKIQPIGNGYLRIPLSIMKQEDLFLWNELFVESAKNRHTRRHLDHALQAYGFQDRGPVHHSRQYHEAYHPHYRVVQEEYVAYFPVFQWAMRVLPEKKILAIDGPCASGKTTLARLLANFFECPCIHMDDYFLQPFQKTQERYRMPGGNVDYERFHQEINEAILKGETIHMHAYDCKTMTMRQEVVVEPNPCLIIEGSYSHHPKLDDLPKAKLYLDVDKESQFQRLQVRNPDRINDFLKKWIPLENAYFSAFHIKEKSDYIFSR